MALSDYNVDYDVMQQLIKDAENNRQEKKAFTELEDGIYIAELENAEFCESKSSGKPMLKLTYHITGDKDNEQTYNQKAWDCTILAGTKNDGYMCWLATKKLEKLHEGFGLSGDWNNDNNRLKSDWIPYAREVMFYLEIKTKNGRKNYNVIDVWDK